MAENELRQQALHKYLDLIEDIINRLAGNSFKLKGWSLTIVAAVFALNLGNFSSTGILFFGIVAIILIFGLLDAYYLSMEREFKNIYTAVVTKANENRWEEITWYNLKINRPKGSFARFLVATKRISKACLSFSVWAFYVVLVLGIITAFFFFRKNPVSNTQKIELENEKISVQLEEKNFDFSVIEQKIADINTN